MEDNKKEFERVVSYLKENGADYGGLIQTESGFEIAVTWGDWKHTHMFLDKLMKELGYILDFEQITDECGDDTYSSIHTYKKA